MGWIKSKAIVMSIVLICAIFSVSLLAPEVEAAQVCCEKTKTGDYCQMTDSSQCDSSFNSASVESCDKASFCRPVCCVDNSQGACYPNTPFSTCFNGADTTYDANVPSCDARVISACRLGCCDLGGSYSLQTEQQCNVQAQNYQNYFSGEQYFYPSVTNERDCLQLGRSADEGCCIAQDKTCSFTSRDQCSTSSAVIKANGDSGFYKGETCSSSSLSQSCGCTPHASKGCVEGSDDVYWFDSCGNRESIAEDCDLDSKATVCGLNKAGNNYICRTANCENPTYYTTSPNTDVPIRKHSESWCVYESGVGEFKDRPGTRHYKATCSNGVELIEECRDFREEICVEANVTSADLGTFSEAQCLYNDIYDSPIDERISTVPLGTKFWQSESRTSTRRQGSDVCAQGNTPPGGLTVWYVKEKRVSEWRCKGNCEFETQEWIDSMANYCKAQGDCGADVNILGKRSSDGFIVEWTGSARGPKPTQISEAQWKEWEKYGIYGGIKELGKAITQTRTRDSGFNRAQQIGNTYATYVAIGGVVAGFATATVIGLSVGLQATLAAILGIAAASAATVVGVVVAAVILIVAGVLYTVYGGGNVRGKVVNVYCNPWVPPSGGDDCKACNDDPLGCTEYKCKSLGVTCNLINEGTDQQKCIDQHPNDVNSPIISPWEETLTKGYSVSKFANGYEIQPKIKPFTRINFGFKTNEPAQCKLDTKHTDSFDEMPHFFGNNPLYITDHNVSLSLPSGQDYTYYLRCKDGKGNKNSAEYAIKVSTEVGPDFTPPAIDATSIENGASIRSDAGEQPLSIYLNEPAQCRWATTDLAYDAMTKTFACMTELNEDQTFLNLYECVTNLENIKPGQDTNFYFKCQDNAGNINKQGYKFTLRKSEILQMTLTTDPPLTGTQLTANQFTIKATTSGGSDEGSATCRFSQVGATDYDRMIDFFDTGGIQHTQSLSLQEGSYNLNVICRDLALNEALGRLQFRLQLDRNPPKLTQVYKQAGNVFVLVDEDAKCEYSKEEFTYGKGTSLATVFTKTFTIQEPAEEYWVACEDKFGNIMAPIHIVP